MPEPQSVVLLQKIRIEIENQIVDGYDDRPPCLAPVQSINARQQKKYEHDEVNFFYGIGFVYMFLHRRVVVKDFILGKFSPDQAVDPITVLGIFFDESNSYFFINGSRLTQLHGVKKGAREKSCQQAERQ